MGHIGKIDQYMKEKEAENKEGIRWLSIKEPMLRLSGFPFYVQGQPLHRIPERWQKIFQKVNPNINALGSNTAGGQLSFRSDTQKIYIRASLEMTHDMSNMTAIGQCGFDCYIGHDRNHMKFMGATRYDIKNQNYEVELATWPLNDGMKEILIHFPLYDGIREVFIGVEEHAQIESPSPFSMEGGIVFYGTSITQGGCASRPGMAYTNIIGRKLNLETYNFGFSANGLGEYEMADMLAEIENPLMYVLDYEANSGTNGRMVASLQGFIERLREKHKETPILVLSRISYIMDILDEKSARQREELRIFQKGVVDNLRTAGDMNIYFYDGNKLWDEGFDDYTVDILHPTDLGFHFMAEKLKPVIDTILS